MSQVKTEKACHFLYKSETYPDLPAVDETITIRRMTVADGMKISALKARFLGGLPALTAYDDLIAEKFATVQALVKSETIKLDTLLDDGLIDALYREVKAFNDSFRKSAGPGAGQGTGEGQPQV